MKSKNVSKKKIISILIIGFIIILFILANSKGMNNSNDEREMSLLEKVKYDEIPNYMMTKPKTKKDKARANTLLKELEDKYNVNFTLIGVAYSEVELNVDEVAVVYAYSDDYPNVYVSNGSDYDDRYLEKIEGWKIKNKVYDIAYNLGIDINYLGVLNFLEELNSDNVSFEIIVNEKITMQEVRTLLQEIYNELNVETLNVTMYHTERGTNDEFKEFMRGLIITESWLEIEFGNWIKYGITVDSSGISTEHLYTENN